MLTIGTRFDDRSSSSWHPGYSWNFPKTKLIHVDLDPQELGRNYPPTLGIIADAKVFTAQLLNALGLREQRGAASLQHQYSEWRAEVAAWRAEWEAFVRPNFGKLTTPLRPEYVVDALQKVLPDDAILTCDSGVHHNWFMQFWRPKRTQSMLNSWGYSSMGFGVCSVLGAQLAAPERPCVSVCGDGGFSMTPYVVATAVEYDLPCVWVVWNNFSWAAIRDIQVGMFGGRELGTAFYRAGSAASPTTRTSPPGRAPAAPTASRSRRARTSRARCSRRSATSGPACSTCTWTPRCGRRPPAPGSCRRRRSRNRRSASRGWPEMSGKRAGNSLGLRRLARHRRGLRGMP